MVEIGNVVKSHGIKGELVVDPTTDIPDERFAPGETLAARRGDTTATLTVTSSRWHKNRLLVQCEEIADRTSADRFRGMRFYAAARDDDGFYDDDLVGLAVICDGSRVGTIAEVQRGVAHNQLVCELNDKRRVLIPFVTAIVPEVDVHAGCVTITPPEGLLDL